MVPAVTVVDNPFVDPGWQRAWFRHFGTGQLEVVPLGEAGEAKLERHGDRLRFLGNREVTDYPGAAIVPGREREAFVRLLQWLPAGDTLEVENARKDGFAALLVLAAEAVAEDEPIATLTLPRTWEGYLAGLRKHERHEILRKRRRAAGTRMRPGGLDTFFTFLRAARGEKGRFLTPRIEAFLREAVPAHPMTRLDVLETADGRPIAATLGFQGPRTYFLYNMGFDPAAAHLSPGIVLLSRLIERAIGERRERLDFMRGLEHYKLQLGAEPSTLINIRVTGRRAAGRSAR
jgi:CelD/BcsL family acetyltransferase involved in cellulose biosynthesis